MSEQLSFLSDLYRASDTRKPNLCTSWKNAIMNEHGVFIENRIDIDVYKSKSKCYPRITIHCALEYPRVYYSFDLMGETCRGGGHPGYGSSNFDVHEHIANVTLMVEQNLRSHISKDHKIPEKMIREAIDKFQKAITSTDAVNQYTTPCDGCGRNIPNEEIMDYEDKKLCVDCWEKTAFADEDDENDEGNENQDKFKERRDENGWYICPCCGEKVANPVDSGFCAECDYKKKHPDAEKKFCDDCILTCEVVEKYGKENAELKQKLEDVQASAYAESVDAGMRERRLRRAFYKACANWAHIAVAFFSSYVTKDRWRWMELKCLKKAEEYK